MVILKTSIKILFLLALCTPIIYLQYCILKSTAKDIKRDTHSLQGDAPVDSNKERYYRKEILRVAK